MGIQIQDRVEEKTIVKYNNKITSQPITGGAAADRTACKSEALEAAENSFLPSHPQDEKWDQGIGASASPNAMPKELFQRMPAMVKYLV